MQLDPKEEARRRWLAVKAKRILETSDGHQGNAGKKVGLTSSAFKAWFISKRYGPIADIDPNRLSIFTWEKLAEALDTDVLSLLREMKQASGD